MQTHNGYTCIDPTKKRFTHTQKCIKISDIPFFLFRYIGGGGKATAAAVTAMYIKS